ncbi:MAG: hypothetical protein HXY34_02650 [Candidatus Thorarchaeota archaeon]|nr:hypothetical protein [Candidatus Thorarchaeota archaeon]
MDKDRLLDSWASLVNGAQWLATALRDYYTLVRDKAADHPYWQQRAAFSSLANSAASCGDREGMDSAEYQPS